MKFKLYQDRRGKWRWPLVAPINPPAPLGVAPHARNRERARRAAAGDHGG